MVRRLLLTCVSLIAGVAALGSGSAWALAPPTPWDGTNPFRCTVQDAGLGTAVPDPGADPYCVRFDKTHQNLTQLGIVDFLLKEPARTAAAVPKCFYFQEDHWRGSVIQAEPGTVVYEFQGHYFFNKATGDGGAWVTGFTIAGQTFDPTSLPGFPPGYGRYFGPGTGGVITHHQIPVDPRCAALANSNPAAIYAAHGATPRCAPAAGHIDRHGVGPITLGMSEAAVRARLGRPQRVKRGFESYCVEGGGDLLVGQPGDRSGTLGADAHAPTQMLLTTSPAFVLRGRHGRLVSVGSSAGLLRRAQRIGTVHAVTVLRSGDIIAGVVHRKVVYLGDYNTRAIRSRRILLTRLGRVR
jgi:hypothetical protein